MNRCVGLFRNGYTCNCQLKCYGQSKDTVYVGNNPFIQAGYYEVYVYTTWYIWEATSDSYRTFASFADYLADCEYSGKMIGEVVARLAERMADAPYSDIAKELNFKPSSPGMKMLGTETGLKAARLLARAEAGWNAEQDAKLEEFKKTCKDTCAKKKGKSR